MTEPQYVYRVVYADTGDPWCTGGCTSRQHVYIKKGTAQGIVTARDNEREYSRQHGHTTIPVQLKIQRSVVEWEDLPN